jgi:uncharacterized membrane protein
MTTAALPSDALAPAAVPTPPARSRLDGIDAVRGLAMVLMALDHVRDLVQTEPYRATDLAWTTPALFASRIVTHLCAPIFILLAGTGIYLARRRKTPGAMAWFLVTRGLWLVLLELTVIKFFWFQTVDYSLVQALVIWVIGWSMVLMSAMVFLPTPVVAGIGVFIVLAHNMTDGIRAADAASVWPPLGPLWSVLHSTEPVKLSEHSTLFPPYVILPWFGVMCAGYGLGALFNLDRPVRRRVLTVIGLIVVLSFALVRGLNGYGDPRPWAVQLRDPASGKHFDTSQPPDMPLRFKSPPPTPGAVPDAVYTAMSVVNTTKYPPSLAFLLMTLGPAMLLLAAFDRPLGPIAGKLVVFGRVPLFYYLLHLPLIVLCAGAIYTYGHSIGWYGAYFETREQGLGLSLPAAYGCWLAVIVILYFPCRWFAAVKARSRAAWLSYL